MNSRQGQGLILLAILLLILLIGSGWWGFGQKNKKEALSAENEELVQELSGLTELKDKLVVEVDSLQGAYLMLAEENESLQGSFTEAQEKLAKSELALRNAKGRSAAEVNNLRAEIQALLEAKDELEGSIQDLVAENDSLRTMAGMLEADLGVARQENAALNALNRTIQDELAQLTLANFKATAFTVEVERKSSKVTAKSRGAKRIKVSFDLTNVPDEYRGTRPLYLVVTDEKGTPISAENPVEAQSEINGQTVPLIAVKATDVNITENQRLYFNHDLEDRLRPGYYRTAVYTDIGLLGAASFRLR